MLQVADPRTVDRYKSARKKNQYPDCDGLYLFCWQRSQRRPVGDGKEGWWMEEVRDSGFLRRVFVVLCNYVTVWE